MFEIDRHKDFFVGIDSDGCAFDTMELKHKECFVPNTIKYYGLQAISKYAREAAEFVNLYSRSRGINRFPALIETLEWLQKRPEVKARNLEVSIPESVQQWIEEESKLGNPALRKKLETRDDPDLKLALEWSLQVNEVVANMVSNVPPFPLVRESLEKLHSQADIVVCSATPNEALRSEWGEHGLDQYILEICGQESGSKKETLASAAKYDSHKSLMIGDAPGDFNAAKYNNCLFYPINPGDEDASWKRFLEEGIDKFLDGSFAGEYQQQLLDEFEKYLPELPPWPVTSP